MRTAQSRLPGGPWPGQIHVLRSDLLTAETRNLLSSAARVVIVAQRGSLRDQLHAFGSRMRTGQLPPTLPTRWGQRSPISRAPRGLSSISNFSMGLVDFPKTAPNM